MKKDFYFVLAFSIFFLMMAGARMGPAIASWRKIVFYLIHPTAGSFLAAHRQVSQLRGAWHDLFEARRELEDARQEIARLREANLIHAVHAQGAAASGGRRVLEAQAGDADALSGFQFAAVEVAYRGQGEKLWSSVACIRPARDFKAAENANDPVLQFSTHKSQFVLAGKRLARGGGFADLDCFELVTAQSFALAAQIASTGESALLRGMGRPDRLALEYLPKDSMLQVGDVVVTSPISSFAPSGILVGEVMELDPPQPTKLFAKAYVRPYLNIAKLNNLVVLSK